MTNCFSCHQEIAFDEKHISEKSHKKIPLDPATMTPHDCPAKKTDYPKSTQGEAMRRGYPETASPTADLPSDDNDEGYDQKAAAIAASSTSSTTKNVFQERDERISASHQENIIAWDAQTAALNKLSTAVDMLTAAITRQTQRKEMDDISERYAKRGEQE